MQDAAGIQQTPKEEKQKAYEAPEHINPNAIPRLYSTISEFLEGGENRVVFLDGLEYLVTQNSFKSILRFINSLRDVALINKNYFLISYDPKAIEEHERHLIGKESSEEYGLNIMEELFVKNRESKKGFVNFAQMLYKGYEGLCVTRLYRKTRDFFDGLLKISGLPEDCGQRIKSTQLYWLTTNLNGSD